MPPPPEPAAYRHVPSGKSGPVHILHSDTLISFDINKHNVSPSLHKHNEHSCLWNNHNPTQHVQTITLWWINHINSCNDQCNHKTLLEYLITVTTSNFRQRMLLLMSSLISNVLLKTFYNILKNQKFTHRLTGTWQNNILTQLCWWHHAVLQWKLKTIWTTTTHVNKMHTQNSQGLHKCNAQRRALKMLQ